MSNLTCESDFLNVIEIWLSKVTNVENNEVITKLLFKKNLII